MEARLRTDRQYWVRADVCCLMCGRRLGHLLGPTEPAVSRPPSAGPRLVFAVFRATDPESPARRLAPGVCFGCATCGGQGMIDEMEMETVSIQNETRLADEETSASTPPSERPLRSPRPMTNGRPADLRLLK